MNNPLNQLILGDCLDVLKTLSDESVDLCYIDPPFFSNRNYEVIWGDTGEIRSFQDRWSGGLDHYIGWLKERVEQIYRVLKPTGSFYLHCDWHADAYIRVFILDKIFGDKCFRNEIIWSYDFGGRSKDLFPRKHDNIYFYTKSKQWCFNFDDLPRITKTGNMPGRLSTKTPTDVWDMPIINTMAKERLGYPTQKPEALLERIIKASSNEGDVVLDCFVGGGTTIAVADRLKRRWIGIDQSEMSIKVCKERLKLYDN